MKSFLTAWLAEAPGILARELAGELELRPSAQLPQPETATTLAVIPGGSYQGRFLVTTDRYALHALFAAARVTDGSLDADRDRELWCGILQQIAELTVKAIVPPQSAGDFIAVEDSAWTLGLPSAAYELRFGETILLLAFTDEVEPSQSLAAKNVSERDTERDTERDKERDTEQDSEQGREHLEPPAETAPEIQAGPLRTDKPAKITPAGIDLLLDVELEASLRFGSREMPLNEVLDLGAGDVVELDRHLSDPVDLLVGDKIVARGEVVLVNGSFGLRVLEVAEPRKCLESIRCLF